MERITLVDDSRQEQMAQDLGLNQEHEAHVIIGCGGIGFWLGIMLTMMQARYIVVMDGDTLDNTNLSRIPVPQTWVGINKAVALRKTIRTLRPDTVVTCLTTHINEDTLELLDKFTSNMSGNYNHYHNHRITTTNIWDTTDDARIQQKISEYVENLRSKRSGRVATVRYRKMGYDGFNIGGYENMNTWKLPDTYEPGYRTTNANAISSAIAAGLGIFGAYLSAGDVNVDLRKLIQRGGLNDSMDKRKKDK
jgi:hypothetical protein